MYMIDGITAGVVGGTIENSLWNLLMTIADEDIGPADPSAVIKIYELYKRRRNVLELDKMMKTEGYSIETQAQMYIASAAKVLANTTKSRVSNWFAQVHNDITNVPRITYQDVIAGLRTALNEENLEDAWYYINYAFRIKTTFGKNTLRNKVIDMLKIFFKDNDYVAMQFEMLDMPNWKNITVITEQKTVFVPVRGKNVVISGSHSKPPPELKGKKIKSSKIEKIKTDLYADTKPLIKLASIFLMWKYCQLPTNEQTTEWLKEIKTHDVVKDSLALVNFYKSGHWRPVIPEYAYCMHTNKGRSAGKGMRHFVAHGCALAKESSSWRNCALEYQKLVLKDNPEFSDIHESPEECIIPAAETKTNVTKTEAPVASSSSIRRKKFIRGF
jgi:hypothetical protein